MGGEMFWAYDYILDHGVGTEAEYPYEALDNQCVRESTTERIEIPDYERFPRGATVKELSEWGAEGPVAIGVEVQYDF